MTKRLIFRNLGLYALLTLVAIGLLAALGYASFWFLFLRDPPLAEVEDKIGVQLPESAANVDYSYSQFLDIHAYLRFTLPADDLQSLPSQMSLDDETLEAGYVSRYISGEASSNPAWWMPDIEGMSAFSGGDCRFVDERFHTYSILVDESDGELLEVFLYAVIGLNRPD